MTLGDTPELQRRGYLSILMMERDIHALRTGTFGIANNWHGFGQQHGYSPGPAWDF
ncbi:hypothetical protein [Bombella sp. ESL0385]|uniref:hypothetical protein n=1 Tax=Bombella sp. ESL0385 TaxID=2676446 RepID=UPI0012D8E6F9|nr:hypothetical protein [Bombella sp. ESL0385]MUG90129.1 hypothetical protein [Bombella sp. ESL0385]